MSSTTPPFEWPPHLVVATVVERDGRFLCVEERIEGRSVINQPAGHWDPGESLIEAAIRETLEETAWHIEPTALLGVYHHHPPGLAYGFLRFAFVGRALREDSGRELDHGIERALWLSEHELRSCTERHRGPMVLRCLDDYLAGRRLPLESLASLEP
jgi:ADP-ribose pyrophosphatase